MSVHIIVFNLDKKSKIFVGWKKDIVGSVHKTFGMQIMTGKTTTLQTLYLHVVLNGVIFPQIHDMILIHVLDSFYLSWFFPPSITLINYASSYRKM